MLLRHARTALTGARYCGRTDPELSEAGRVEAALAARRIAVLAPEVDAVISSPSRRASATARLVAERYGLVVRHEPALREIDFGEFEGLTFDEARAARPVEFDAWLGAGADARPPGGESLDEAAARTELACRRILAEHAERVVVLVSHSTPIATLLCRALGAPLLSRARLRLDPAGLSWIDWYGPDEPVIRFVNDTPTGA